MWSWESKINPSRKRLLYVHLQPMAELHAPWSDTMWTAVSQHCVLPFSTQCLYESLSDSQGIFTEGLLPANQPYRHWSVTQWCAVVPPPAWTAGTKGRLTAAFLISVLCNLAECLARGRGLINISWMWETEGGERRSQFVYVKESGLFNCPNRPSIHQKSDDFWKAPHAMHSCRHSSCHAKQRSPELGRIQPFVSLCLFHNQNEVRPNVNLPVSSMSSTSGFQKY